MAIQARHRSFIRLPFARFGLSEPLHVLLGLRNSPNELFDAELSVCQRPHPALRASISAPLECVPVNFRDDAGRVGRTRLLSRSDRRKEGERRNGACNDTPHEKTLL